MPGQRSKDKKYIGWWAPADLRERLRRFTGARNATETDVLNAALAGYLAENDTTETTGEQ